jgi:hypothetical protein
VLDVGGLWNLLNSVLDVGGSWNLLNIVRRWWYVELVK